jgi:hypothetical protein
MKPERIMRPRATQKICRQKVRAMLYVANILPQDFDQHIEADVDGKYDARQVQVFCLSALAKSLTTIEENQNG